MIPTKEIMMGWFVEYNEKYFNNQLPKSLLALELSKRKSAWGDIRYPSYRTNGKYRIRLSIFCDRAEKSFRQTLIHEMIHFYCHYVYGERGHKWRFKECCQRINKDGWNLSTATSAEETDIPTQTTSEMMVAFTFKSSNYPDKLCLSISSLSCYRKIEGIFTRIPHLELLNVTTMSHPEFIRMRKSVSRINYLTYSPEEFKTKFPTIKIA